MYSYQTTMSSPIPILQNRKYFRLYSNSNDKNESELEIIVPSNMTQQFEKKV